MQLACVEAAFPFAMSERSCVVDTLLKTPLSQMSQSLTPSCQSAVAPDAQSVVISGIPHERVFGSVMLALRICAVVCCGTDGVLKTFLGAIIYAQKV